MFDHVELLGLIVVLAIVLRLLLPWIQQRDLHRIQERLARIERDLADLRARFSKEEQPVAAQSPAAEKPYAREASPAREKMAAHAEQSHTAQNIGADEAESWVPVTSAPAARPSHVFVPAARTESGASVGTADGDRRSQSFESAVFLKLALWAGAAAIFFAVLYFVRYSIAAGLLSPLARVIGGIALGAAALSAGQIIEMRASVAHSRRIAQALTAVGLGGCYASVYAANALYHLIPNPMAFTFLAAIAGFGVCLAVQQGVAIALVSSAFGFLTPALVGSEDPSTILLFSYLYVFLMGNLMLARRYGWALLSTFTCGAVYLWTLVWVFGGFDPANSWAVLLFLFATTTSILFIGRELAPTESAFEGSFAWKLHLGEAAIGVILAAVILPLGHYAASDIALYSALSVALFVPTWRDEVVYRPLAFMATALMFVLCVGITPVTTGLAGLILGVTGFAVCYHIAIMPKSARPHFWAAYGALALCAGFLTLWLRFHALGILLPGVPHPWFLIALGHAAVALALGIAAYRQEEKTALPALYGAAAAGLLAMGCMAEIGQDRLPAILAILFIAADAICNRAKLRNGAWIGNIALGFLLISLIPFTPLLLALPLSCIDSTSGIQLGGLDPASLPLSLLLPGIAMLSSIALSRELSPGARQTRGIAGSALLVYGGYFAVRALTHLLTGADDIAKHALTQASFIEGGVITDISLAAGLGLAVWSGEGQRLAAESKRLASFLVWLALARIGYFDILFSNPFFTHLNVGGLPLLNGLLLPYLAPLLFFAAADRAGVAKTGVLSANLRGVIRKAWLVLPFLYVTLALRQIVHGAYLDEGTTGTGETYACSVVWLAYGAAVLAAGIAKQSRGLRQAALIVLTAVTGKVFLYDASTLSGLYRVFSFLGLGIALVAISFLYNRFVLKAEK